MKIISDFIFSENPIQNIGNASGCWCQTEKELLELNDSESDIIVAKSCTIDPRKGNPEPRYQSLPLGSINSMGLPNGGIRYYLDFCENNQKLLKKPFILSIAGLSFDENKKLLTIAQTHTQISCVEMNLSCPNIPNKPQVGYDFEALKRHISMGFEVYSKPLAIKLPPYFDPVHFDEITKIIENYPLAYICCINSLGNAVYIDENDQMTIKPNQGFGGLGGEYIKPTALANVFAFFSRMPQHKIVGCGGIRTGRDIYEHYLCGASAVQIGTQLVKEGVSCFSRLKTELSELLVQKKYKNLEEFKGKIKLI